VFCFSNLKPSIGYSSLGGLSPQIAQLSSLILTPLRHPELYSTLGIPPPRGVLLTGPSGVGKTSLARAVASEADVFVFTINGGEVVSKKAGESETNLRRAFEEAGSRAREDGRGAIIIIDEIDAFAGRRDGKGGGGGGGGGETEKRIVSQLLTLMDGLSSRAERVVVVGCTNRPMALDPALRRSGRFDRELDLKVPTEGGRREILEIVMGRMNVGE